MFHRRLTILIYFCLILMVILIARLAWIQLGRGDYYREKVKADLVRPGRLLETVRGTIYDAQHRPLAIDRPTYDLCLHYKLTRIFDNRFWQYQAVKRTQGDVSNTMPRQKARSFLIREFNFSRQEADVMLAGFSEQDGVPLGTIQQLITQKAQQLLTDLANVSGLSAAELDTAVKEINDRVYGWSMARARRLYYQQHPELTRPPVHNLAEIQSDLEALIPDPQQRLERIGQADILEMNQAHTAIHNIPEEIAQLIEVEFMGGLTSRQTTRPISLRSSKGRDYPYQDVACHLIGQLGPLGSDQNLLEVDPEQGPNPDDLAAYRLDDRRGDWGIEYLFEDMLRGRRGWVRYDADGQLITRINPQTGLDIEMTIDIELQRDIQYLIESYGYIGGIALIDVPTGRIRALVSTPTFDLNTIYQTDQYALVRHERADYYWENRALTVNYQPGSSIKPIVLSAALKYNIVNEHTELHCSPRDPLYTAGPQCGIYGHGNIAAVEAIKKSCNFYFIHAAEQLGPQRFQDWLKRFGFGKAILVWPNGPYNDMAWNALRETSGHLQPIGTNRLSVPAMRYMAIGRGAFDASVLQIANGTATIARDGVFLPPTLCQWPLAHAQPHSLSMTPQQIALVHRAMQSVIYDHGGTAYKAFQPLPWPREQVALFGKTGSTDYSTFSCFARVNDGRCIALAITVEIDAHGSDVAAPLAREILIIAASHNYLPPPELP